MAMTQGIAGILLAAGRGSRFGGGKLMHCLSGGRPMAVAAAINLVPACERMVAVLRPEDAELAAALAGAGCEIVLCNDADLGMGYSLAAGVKATPEAAAWIVALADMPFIASTTHRAIAASLNAGASLAASEYHGKRGHPVGFSRQWFDELSAMTGDQGGRAILDRNKGNLVLCQVNDPGIHQDIDCKEDLAKIVGPAVKI
jgi:molybdenum cofactor cytidylyltransferase